MKMLIGRPTRATPEHVLHNGSEITDFPLGRVVSANVK